MLKALVSFCLATLLCAGGALADPGTPRDRVETASREIMTMLNSQEFKDPATKAGVRKQLEGKVMEFFDFEEFSSRTVGPRWKQFTPEQKQDFITAFTDLLRNSYIDTLDSYNGQQIAYVGEVSSDGGSRVEVRMVFKAQQDYPVAFRMLVKNDAWVVYDVIIENVSMIKNYREQFRDVLAKGSPDSLIERVRAKAAEQAAAKTAAK